jgi:hypothetical protein
MSMTIMKDYLIRVVLTVAVTLFPLMINESVNATEVTILYTGDALGEIEPCG